MSTSDPQELFMTLRAASGKPKFLDSGGSMVAKLKLKGIDGRKSKVSDARSFRVGLVGSLAEAERRR